MIESSKFQKFDEEIQTKYKNIILNQSQQLNEQINFNDLLESGEQISDKVKGTLQDAVQFSFSKMQPAIVKYFQAMMKKSDELGEQYCFGPNLPDAIKAQNIINFSEWRQQDQSMSEVQTQSPHKKSQSHSPDRRSLKIAYKEICKNCKMQITSNKNYNPFLDSLAMNEPLFVDENTSFIDAKRKEFIKNKESVPEYEFTEHRDRIKVHAAATKKIKSYHKYITDDNFENVEDKIEFLETHKMSTKNVIMKNIKEQNQKLYSRFFLFRMFKALDTDCLFQNIIDEMKQNLINYLDSYNFQIKYHDQIKVSLQKLGQDKGDLLVGNQYLIDQKKQREIERQEHLRTVKIDQLEKRVIDLQNELNTKNIQYYRELENYRQHTFRQESQALEGTRVVDDYLNVQLFETDDETLFIPQQTVIEFKQAKPRQSLLKASVTQLASEEIKFNLTQAQKDILVKRLNGKLEKMKLKYEQILNINQRAINELKRELSVYKSLPQNLQFLASMEMTELMGYIAIIEQDPFVIYEKIEEVYQENFFEGVIYKKFSHLFDDNKEENFKEQMDVIKKEVMERLSTYQVNLAISMDYHQDLTQQVARDYQDLQVRSDQDYEKIRREERFKLTDIQFQTEQKMNSQFSIYKKACNEEIHQLELSLQETDKVIVNNRLKQFLFRWHVKTLFKRLIAEEKAKSSDHTAWARIAHEIMDKCKHDAEAQVIKELQPFVDKIKEQEATTQDQKAHIIEMTYERRNLQKINAQLVKQIEATKEASIFTETKLRWANEKLHKLLLAENIEREENINFRKIIDSQNKKVDTLQQKLKRIGVKLPISNIEKKMFYSNNDKMLEQSSLVHEVHNQIRQAFNVSIPTKILDNNDLKGSFEFLVAELKQQLQTELKSSSSLIGGGLVTKQKSTKEQGCQTPLRDLRSDLIYRSNMEISGEVITHSHTQTAYERKEFADGSTTTFLTKDDVFHLEQKNKEYIELIKKLKEEQKSLNYTVSSLKNELTAKEEEILEMKDSYVDRIQKDMKQKMNDKFKKRKTEMPKTNKLQSAVSKLVLNNKQNKLLKKSTEDEIKTKLGAKITDMYKDASDAAYQKHCHQQEKDEQMEAENEKSEQKDLVTLELQSKQKSPAEKSRQDFEDEEVYEMSPIPIPIQEEKSPTVAKAQTPGSQKLERLVSAGSKIVFQPSPDSNESVETYEQEKQNENVKANPVDISFNINPQVTLVNKVHKVGTGKRRTIATGFSGIRSNSNILKLESGKTRSTIKLKGKSVIKRHQSESKFQYAKEIRNIETEDIQTQTPNIDNYDYDSQQKSVPKMNYDSNVDLFDQDLTEISLNDQAENRQSNLVILPYHAKSNESRKTFNNQIIKSKENKEWKLKMAGNNTLDNKIAGMTIYQNLNSGQQYVHLNELKQMLSTKELEQNKKTQLQNQSLLKGSLYQQAPIMAERPKSQYARSKFVSRQTRNTNKSETSFSRNKDIQSILDKSITINKTYKPVSRNDLFCTGITRCQSATADKINQRRKDIANKSELKDMHYMDNQIQQLKDKRDLSRNIISQNSVQTLFNTQEATPSIFKGLIKDQSIQKFIPDQEERQIVNATSNAAYFSSTQHMSLNDFIHNNKVPIHKHQKTTQDIKAQVDDLRTQMIKNYYK